MNNLFKSRSLLAIAAMGGNRVIADGPRIPWHLPEDFRFFKATTMGHILVMGRRTYESIGRPLPGRTTVVLTRNPGALELPAPSADGKTRAQALDDLARLENVEPEKKIFIAGGGEIYRKYLRLCSELYLTHVAAAPQGDILFPPYEQWFDAGEVLMENPAFTIRLHRNLALREAGA